MKYRIQVPGWVCFTISAENDAAAQLAANKHVERFLDGLDIDQFDLSDDNDSRLYVDELAEPEITDSW